MPVPPPPPSSRPAALDRYALRRMAESKLQDAKALFAHRRYDGAVYNCGYVVEFALKARICATLHWSEYLVSDSYRSFRTHNLEVLLALTGRGGMVRRHYQGAWATVSQWDPEQRYRRSGGTTKAMADLMIRSSEILLRAI